MKISSILTQKGDFVATVSPEATVSELLALLAEHRIGAVVVADPERVRRRAHDLLATTEEFLAAAWTSADVTSSVNGSRRVLMLRHMPRG